MEVEIGYHRRGPVPTRTQVCPALVQEERASRGGWISIKLKAGVLLTRLLRMGDGENKQEG